MIVIKYPSLHIVWTADKILLYQIHLAENRNQKNSGRNTKSFDAKGEHHHN